MGAPARFLVAGIVLIVLAVGLTQVLRQQRPEPAPARLSVARDSRWGAGEVWMAHLALTDVAGRRFRHAERLSREALGLAGAGGRPLRVWLEDWQAVEVAARPWAVRLTGNGGDWGIDLTLRAVKPEVLNGAGGLSRKGGEPGNASYYYSLPRMETSGTIRAGGMTFTVSGLSWLDREWSTSVLAPDQAGWDWFALHLSDGRDLMYYRLRRRDGTTDPASAGTIVAADGSYRHLAAAAATLETLSWWSSPAGGARYPSRWRLRIPAEGIDLDIVPRLTDQELFTTVRYWEGAVEVRSNTGKGIAGSGYVELTGYGDQDVSAN
ncbi:lipocalin family protein [Geobacter sulfurreducens]|uniref:lipocalin-like domain-containing protein n=1 Tax=Geobacter sulfurreducens TaxID=35554 RepID=UPI002CF86F5D|nr:lipocalin family protein [Geobacter sulfurreducens]HML78951.1 lipocalin family protein [Geobacter sulfurreducens]